MKTFRFLYALLASALVLACSKAEQEPDRFNIDATDVMLMDYKEGSTDVLLATNREPVATVEETAGEWLSAEITPRCLMLSYKENTVEEERVGKVNILAGSIQITVTVTQPAYVAPDPEPPVDDDTYELYDLYSENGKVVGVVFWVSEDKKSALVVSLDRSGTMPWSYDGTRTIGTGTSNGAENTALLRASEEAESIPALTFCDDHGDGWYWPSLSELELVFEAYNGTAYEDATKAVPANITDEEKAARIAFDKLLVDNGGVAMNVASEDTNGDEYWSSTEQIFEDVTYGSMFRFGKPYASGGGDQMTKTKDGRRFVRCVKAVGVVAPVEPEEPVETKFPVYEENGKKVGIVYWTSEDGKTSKVLSLQRTEEIPWSYNGDNAIECSSKEDGAANMAIIKASPEAAEIPALAFCKSLGDGWYWPAIFEMREVFEAYNGKLYAEVGNVFPKDLSGEESAARAAFDLSLTTYGGTAMNLKDSADKGDRYWCSTEYFYEKDGKYYGSFMQFGKAYMNGPADQSGKTQSSGRYARCIKVITNE